MFSGESRWYVIEVIESFDGRRVGPGFLIWFSSNAFGGTNYSHTPLAGVTHVEEPTLGGVNDPGEYFGGWVAGKPFGIIAGHSRRTPYFQAVGDPFVKK
jgi:hypothetical protein